MNAENMIPVECPNAQTKFSGKRVRFFIDDDSRRFLVVGVLHVKLVPTRVSIEVFGGYDGHAYHFDFYHLPQSAVDSIRSTGDDDVPFEVTEIASCFIRRQTSM